MIRPAGSALLPAFFLGELKNVKEINEVKEKTLCRSESEVA